MVQAGGPRPGEIAIHRVSGAHRLDQLQHHGAVLTEKGDVIQRRRLAAIRHLAFGDVALLVKRARAERGPFEGCLPTVRYHIGDLRVTVERSLRGICRHEILLSGYGYLRDDVRETIRELPSGQLAGVILR